MPNKCSVNNEALRTFVDACQVLVGRLDDNADESIAFVCETLLRMLRRRPGPAACDVSTNFRVQRAVRYIEEKSAESTIHLAAWPG
jgi:hypothetical protein